MKKLLLLIGFTGSLCAYADTIPSVLMTQPKNVKVAQNFLQDVTKSTGNSNYKEGKIKTSEVNAKSAYAVVSKPIELGVLNVYSVIGQPLDAEVEIKNGEYYTTTVATTEEYESRGLLKENFIKNVNINVVKKNDKRFIKLSSKEPLPTGFLDLVLVLQKDKQKDTKELILSAKEQVLPGSIPVDSFAQTSLYKEVPKPMVATKEMPKSNKVTYEYIETENLPKKRMAIPSPSVQEPLKTAVSSDKAMADEYVISRGETVYTIAEKLNPNILKRRFGAVLYLENPSCFLRGDMNKIIAGKSLKVPSLEVINKYSDAEINRRVDMANKNWLGGEKAPVVAKKEVKEKEVVVKSEVKHITPEPKAEMVSEAKPEAKKEEVKQDVKLVVPNLKNKELEAKKAEDLKKIKELEENVAKSNVKLIETNENVKKLEKQVKELNAQLNSKDEYILQK